MKSSNDFADMMDHTLATRFIETLAGLYLRQFQDRVERFQEASDPTGTDRLWDGISRDLFGA